MKKSLVLVQVYLAIALVTKLVAGLEYTDNVCDSEANSLVFDQEACIYSTIQSALMNSTFNQLHMRRAFFYSPMADPVLLGVFYNIQFDFNVNSDIPTCDFVNDDDNERIDSGEIKNYTYGWTSSGVYTIIHPLLLNAMQFQPLFWTLRIFNSLIKGGPYVDALLWDGNYLPSVDLYLYNNISIPCVPTTHQVDVILQEITSQLRMLTTDYNKKYQGYALVYSIPVEDPIDHDKYYFQVNFYNYNILGYKQSGSIYGIYLAYTIITHFIAIIVLISVFHNRGRELSITIDKYISKSRPLYSVAILISSCSLVLLTLLDFVLLQYRQYDIGNISTFNAVGPIMFILNFQKIYTIPFAAAGTHMYMKNETKKQRTWIFLTAFVITTEISMFLTYLPPTLLLALVYPTEVISTTAYITSAYISLIVIVAAVAKTLPTPQSVQHLNSVLTCYGLLLLIIFLWFLYVLGFLFVYILAIAKMVAITNISLLLVSLLPSVGLCFISWVIKTKILEEIDDNMLTQDGNNFPRGQTNITPQNTNNHTTPQTGGNVPQARFRSPVHSRSPLIPQQGNIQQPHQRSGQRRQNRGGANPPNYGTVRESQDYLIQNTF